MENIIDTIEVDFVRTLGKINDVQKIRHMGRKGGNE